MNTCVLAYTFYETDGRVMRYAESLARRGDGVDVIALRHRGQRRRERINGVNVIRIQRRSVTEKRRLAYMLKIVSFFMRSAVCVTLRHLRYRYRIIHVHSVPDFEVFAAAIPKLLGARVILDIHDIVPEFYVSKFGAGRWALLVKALVRIERASAAFADHTIASNHIWQERLISRSVSREKCSVFLNYPDPNLFRYSGPKQPNDRFVMMYPGTLSWHQGLDLAIRAFASVKQETPGAEMHIYGGGNELGVLRRLVDDLSMRERVRFMPILPVSQIADKMAAANLGVVPKRSDSFGNEAFSTKILEFMALGVPVLAADTKVDRHYFNEKVIQFFEAGNVTDLADKMLMLFRDPMLRSRLAANALEFAEKHSWSAHEKRYLDLVDSLSRVRG